MKEKLLSKMKQIASFGGEITLSLISEPRALLKQDNSALSEADLKISELSHNILKDLLKTPDHILIDEEETKSVDGVCFEKPFVWVLDPIDGTRVFLNKMPNFGISIGLLKEKKPWLGLVHFPALNEMFYCNGESAYFVQHPFSVNERKREIEFFEQEITENSIFIINDSFIKNFSLHLNIQLMNLACASMSLCWPAISRGCGTFFSANIWDFAGAWPIFEKADLALRSLKDGKELRELDIELFAKTWKLKEPYILSSERNFEIISEKIKPKEV